MVLYFKTSQRIQVSCENLWIHIITLVTIQAIKEGKCFSVVQDSGTTHTVALGVALASGGDQATAQEVALASEVDQAMAHAIAVDQALEVDEAITVGKNSIT